MDDEDEEVTDIKLQLFHNTVRENVIFLLLFMFLYLASFALISRLRRHDRDDIFSNDEDEVLVYRISSWLCTFSLAIAMGAALLLPVSIVSNEVLLLYPNSYYVKWLNSSLIQGLWNHIFLFSNLSLFIFLPFAYLFTESSGFYGHKKGIIARVYETFTVFSLLATVVLGLTYVLSAIFDPDKISFLSVLNLGSVHLPFMYSCVSFLGVLLLLVCTPFGFVRLFGVMGSVLSKPHLLRDVNEEYTAFYMEEASVKRKLANLEHYNLRTSTPSSSASASPASLYSSSIKQYPTYYSSLRQTHSNGNGNGTTTLSNTASASVPPTDITNPASYLLLCQTNANGEMYQRRNAGSHQNHHRRHHHHYYHHNYEQVNGAAGAANATLQEYEFLNERLRNLEIERRELDKLRKSSAFQRNIVYPLAMLLLLFLTGVTTLLVIQNTLELLIGIKALPLSTRNFALGISSLSKIGSLGAALEVFLILYLGASSIVGFYTMPFMRSVRPQKRRTSLSQLILNCALLLILSSALPLLSRILGITNFDLLGDFGAIEWLGNFKIVLLYNLIFGTATALCLVNKFTATVRHELYARLVENYMLFTNYISFINYSTSDKASICVWASAKGEIASALRQQRNVPRQQRAIGTGLEGASTTL